jgi:hypothetical protein
VAAKDRLIADLEFPPPPPVRSRPRLALEALRVENSILQRRASNFSQREASLVQQLGDYEKMRATVDTFVAVHNRQGFENAAQLVDWIAALEASQLESTEMMSALEAERSRLQQLLDDNVARAFENAQRAQRDSLALTSRLEAQLAEARATIAQLQGDLVRLKDIEREFVNLSLSAQTLAHEEGAPPVADGMTALARLEEIFLMRSEGKSAALVHQVRGLADAAWTRHFASRRDLRGKTVSIFRELMALIAQRDDEAAAAANRMAQLRDKLRDAEAQLAAAAKEGGEWRARCERREEELRRNLKIQSPMSPKRGGGVKRDLSLSDTSSTRSEGNSRGEATGSAPTVVPVSIRPKSALAFAPFVPPEPSPTKFVARSPFEKKS